MKTKYYWKVVEKTDKPRVYTSFVVNKGKYCLTYEIGKITKSAIPETGILVFETRDQARDCKKWGTGKITIFKVLPTGKQIPNPIFYDFYNLEENVKTPSPDNRFPNGTVAFDSVKVIGR